MAANRRPWLIICSHLMGEENKPFLLLSQFFSSSSSEIAITSLELLLQLLLVAFGVGEKMGQGGCAWELRLISQAAGRRRWPWGSDQNCKQQPQASGSEGWGQYSPHILWCLPNEEGREMVRERCPGQPLLQAIPAPQPSASHHCCCSTRCWLCHLHTLKVIKSGSKVIKPGSRALQYTLS